MYDSAGAWGGRNPFGGTLVVLTHRTADQPDPSLSVHHSPYAVHVRYGVRR